MMGLLAQGGAEITSRAEDADVIVVNTCSFIDTAKQESVDTILEMAQHKTAGRAQKLIVAGCLVERYRNEIQKNIPEVDAVVGTGELQQILNAAGIHQRAQVSVQGKDANLGHNPLVILNSRSEGDAREAAGRFSKDGWDGADCRPAELSLRRDHAARPGYAEAFGIHQDRGRLRSSVLVLHHSAVARKVSLAAF